MVVCKLSGHVQYLIKPSILKFRIFELESLFISCEFDIPDVIAVHAFCHIELKNHYQVNSAIKHTIQSLLKTFSTKRFFHMFQLKYFKSECRAVARALIGGLNIHIFVLCPTNFF